MRKYEFHGSFLYYYAVILPSATKSKNVSSFQTENPVYVGKRHDVVLYFAADGNALFMRFIGNLPFALNIWVVSYE